MTSSNANLSKEGLQKIFDWETGGIHYYNKVCAKPSYPGGDSGITIGAGYDLGYNTREQIKADWQPYLNPNHLVLLLGVAGRKGDAAKLALTAQLRQIVIPYDVAFKVFISSSVPRFYKLALSIYPDMVNLNADTQAMIVSLVFNRGTKLTGDSRIEMANMVEQIKNKDYKAIAKSFTDMKRLWQGKGLDGLLQRRDEEAVFILKSISPNPAT